MLRHRPVNTLSIGIIMMLASHVFKISAFVLPRIRHAVPKVSSSVVQRLRHDIRSATAVSSARLFSTTTESATTVLKRVRANEALEPTEDPVVVKGWVRTIRKQKTVAFIQVNDGSNLKGIQCVLSITDDMDEQTKKGE
jgi:uncharacterized protein (UPF0305 family)